MGDAGMVTSADAGFIARVRQIANHGAGTHKYDNVVLGTNSRLDALQAAILRVKLRHLDAWDRARRERVAAYQAALADVPGIVVPREAEGARSAWHLFTVRSAERDRLRAHLDAEGIATAVHYPRPIHLQPAMGSTGGRPGDLPVSEQLSREVLCLPLYAELPLEDVARVADAVRAFSAAAARR
jgi:dTDP-4-amino-4,6-dideoxygalactose transaminase